MSRAIIAVLLAASLAWGQQVTFSGQYAVSGQAKTTAQEILHQSTFETGDCSEWTAAPWGCNGAERVQINTVRPHTGSYSMEIHYSASAGQDSTVGLRQTISPAQNLIHIRGYVYLATPIGDVDGVQRKLIWTANDAGAGLSHFLTSDSAGGVIPLRMSLNSSAPCSLSAWSDYSIYTLNYDTWYSIELAIQLNTPGASDGEYWLWVDGVERKHGINKDFRGTCSDKIGSYSLGYQAQGDQATDEYRCWDDVKVSTGYIGP